MSDGISLVMCNTKKCPRPATHYVVSKPGGVSEIHVQMCDPCYDEKTPKFNSQGWSVVRLKTTPGEVE